VPDTVTEHRRGARRRLLILGLVLLVLVGGWTIGWFVLAGRMQTALADWATTRQAAGYNATWNRLEVSGFPFTLIASAEGVHLSADTLAGRVEGAFPALTASIALPRLDRVALDLPPQQRLSLIAPGGRVSDVQVLLSLGQVLITGDGLVGKAPAWRARLTTAATMLVTSGGRITWDTLDVTVAIQPEPATAAGDPRRGETGRLALRLDGLSLPPAAGALHDAGLRRIVAEGRLLGTIPSGPAPETLARWSAGGGTLEIDNVDLAFEGFALGASGSLALDQHLQPLGALSTGLTNPAGVIDLLMRLGVMEPGNSAGAKLALSLLARPDENGQMRLDAPLTLQGGQVRLGPISLFPLPHVRWLPSPSE